MTSARLREVEAGRLLSGFWRSGLIGGLLSHPAMLRWHGVEPGDEEPSALLNEGSELLPLLTLGEARALLYVAHLLGLGDAAAADAAR
ncbi:hypothetical protein BX281_0089 [Streptomyces sp. Ag82_O1-15]|uniref:hypothetical protein n=1 Tax=Streptomyces sp. Ag82_O1-15 TaxID=1938855 RepID=UPI000BB131C0|nr:hypothetical protein [Streptomyces sp. Ag82_O1-15]PBC92438.1 hypothetical protein BX281_0089 [Streptomyces sp. Ag82_O1-15]